MKSEVTDRWQYTCSRSIKWYCPPLAGSYLTMHLKMPAGWSF